MTYARTIRKLRFVPIDTASFAVPMGAVGYVDTDVSATTGTSPHKLWMVKVNGAGADVAGARAHGETKDSKCAAYIEGIWFSYVDSSGHMDLYRVAGTNWTYQLLGYFE